MKAYESNGRMVKRCPGCEKVKDVEAFNKNRRCCDGLAGTCRECMHGYEPKPRPSRAKPKAPRAGEADRSRGVKTCATCQETKPLEQFAHIKKGDVYCLRCRPCDRAKRRRQNLSKAAKGGKTRLEIDLERGWKVCHVCGEQKTLDGFDKSRETSTAEGRYATRCKACNLVRQHRARQEDPERYRQQARRYWKAARQTPGLKERIAAEKRRHRDKYSASYRIGNGIRYTLRHGETKRGRHWETLVDYTMAELVAHLESLFVEGMTWERFRAGEIHVDHIVPKSLFAFETTDDPQFKACWALSNLRPAWESENTSKSDRLPDGRLARNLTPDEKRNALIALGYGHLFTDPTPGTCPASPGSLEPGSPDPSEGQPAPAP